MLRLVHQLSLIYIVKYAESWHYTYRVETSIPIINYKSCQAGDKQVSLKDVGQVRIYVCMDIHAVQSVSK